MKSPFPSGEFRVTQKFTLGVHNGLDIVGVGGDVICAAESGTVESAVEHPYHYTAPLSVNRTREWGCYVKVRHDDGTVCFYCHMLQGSIRVKAGQKVNRGEPLGRMGNTGYSLGAHLHLEVRNRENAVTADTNTVAYTGIENRLGYFKAGSEAEEVKGYGENMSEEEKNEFQNLKNDISEIKEALRSLEERCGVKWGYVDGNMPAWARSGISYLTNKGILKGDERGNLQLSHIELRLLVLLSRALRQSAENSGA